jgi:cyclase
MSKVRIIPTILTDGLTVVKGESFKSWRSVGNTQAMARLFSLRDVDELMLLDVSATLENRVISFETVLEFSEILTIPFSVGGGIRSVSEARKLLRAGAEKVVIGTSAYNDPKLLMELVNQFGSQSVVVSVDITQNVPYQLVIKSGTEIVDIGLGEYVLKLNEIGIGEILLQSIHHDGKLSGMNYPAIEFVSRLAKMPVIASSGASSREDFLEALNRGASAVAAGAIFQFTEVTPKLVKDYLESNNFEVRQ